VVASRSRSYADPCGIARALDLIGERWALLVVRELVLGPKRFTQLRQGLRGVSANVLSQRLRELEESGVVRKRRLGPPASTLVYELTERGAALEPVLVELGRWGSRTPLSTAAELGQDALMVALKSRFDPQAAQGVHATLELRIGEDTFAATIADARLDLTRGSMTHPTATIETDAPTLRALVFGRLALADALSAGRTIVSGERSAADRFLTLFGGG
jgi:DNA-binding HxlR family transcriptional regulator